MSDASGPLHVVRITHGFPPRQDGLSHHAFLLSRCQVADGHRVSVFQPQAHDQAIEGVDVRRITAHGTVLDPARRWDRWLFAAIAARQLTRLHRRDPVDIVHCHGDASDAAPASRVAARLGLPFVVTLHGALSRRRRYRLLAPIVFGSVSRFIVVGEHIRSDLEQLRVDPSRITVISSGIEYQRFAAGAAAQDERRAVRARWHVPEDAVLVAAVGRLHPVKGFDVLIEAARGLPAGVMILIAGDGQARPQLEQPARGLDQVRLCGALPHAELPALLRSADVFTLPSVDLPGQAEGTPTTVMEAMAAGLPLIVSDSGGARYLVEAGGGLVVPQRNVDALRDAIVALAADPGRRQAMGATNREAARARDWPVIAGRVLDVYRQAIRDRGPRP